MKKIFLKTTIFTLTFILFLFLLNKNNIILIERVTGDSCAGENVNNKISTPLTIESEIEKTNLYNNALPEISKPKFVKYSKGAEDTVGIGVEKNGEAKFYPFRIIVWHSILNDCIDNTPILISFCPICQVGIAYVRNVNDQTLEFSIGNEIWLDSLVGIDKETNSKWSFILGESIDGKLKGVVLEKFPSEITSLKKWAQKYPNTLILSDDTGYSLPYKTDYSLESFQYSDPIYDIQKTFVLVLKDDPNKMYILQEPGSIVDDQDLRIEFNEYGMKVWRDSNLVENYFIVPWYLWIRAYPEAKVSEKTI
ncbi:MAG: hypothetical protein KatS3mg085_840 [Candidatus Dojkabacteria bacterium]|nr:MAG: hypothetical protein KatS3mg085_840 [Candidatus Dojkabacteria bacterium]